MNSGETSSGEDELRRGSSGEVGRWGGGTGPWQGGPTLLLLA
jgi:hypothetical protein